MKRGLHSKMKDETLLISYVPKPNKAVIMLSTFHDEFTVMPDDRKKPTMIYDYNSWKGGVDTVDQMTHTYSTQRMTFRWPNVIFYNILDLAALNAYTCWRFRNNQTYDRKKWLQELAYDLMKPQCTESLEIKTPYWKKRTEAAKQAFGLTPSWLHTPSSISTNSPTNSTPSFPSSFKCKTPKIVKPNRKRCLQEGCKASVFSICDNCKRNCCNSHTITIRMCGPCETK